jgi:hypothetical protein
VPLLLALAGRHVDGWPPKNEEHIFDGGEAACVAIASVFLGLCLLCGGTAIELLELLTPKFGKESDMWVWFEKESVWWKEGCF